MRRTTHCVKPANSNMAASILRKHPYQSVQLRTAAINRVAGLAPPAAAQCNKAGRMRRTTPIVKPANSNMAASILRKHPYQSVQLRTAAINRVAGLAPTILKKQKKICHLQVVGVYYSSDFL